MGPFKKLDLEAFHGAFGKLWGYVNSVQLGLEHMTAAGSIVIISGSPARKAPPGLSAISTVGNAVEGFVRAIAPEIVPVRINAVCPGPIDTPLIKLQGEERRQYFQKIVGDQVIPRAGQASEVADAAMFLLRNDFVTGTVVDVDGGALLP
jgi:NAD(P)-dependent dehydrogenase (short-subunit alcohol dehydrogenase family)